MATVIAPEERRGGATEAGYRPPRHPGRLRGGERPNWLGGLAGWIWLLIVIVPIYWIIVKSFKTRANYFITNPFVPASPTLDNYKFVIQQDFISYFVNSVIVPLGATVPAVVFSFMAASAIIRGTGGRWLRWTNSMFL